MIRVCAQGAQSKWSQAKRTESAGVNRAEKSIAERVIKRLCVGAQIDGVRFGPIPQLLLTDHASSKPPIRGQVYLNLASAWTIFDRLPERLPHSEGDFAELAVSEQLAAICSIREQTIVKAGLGEEEPHLLLTLESGKIFFLNGHLEAYEPWQLGVALGDPSECWMVVARPYDAVAVWAPEAFLRDESAA